MPWRRMSSRLVQSTSDSRRRPAVNRAAVAAAWRSSSIQSVSTSGRRSPREGAQRVEAEPALDEGDDLDQHVVGGDEPVAVVYRLAPGLDGVGVAGLVGVEEGQQGGRVDEERHESKASSRCASWSSARSRHPDLYRPARASARRATSPRSTT